MGKNRQQRDPGKPMFPNLWSPVGELLEGAICVAGLVAIAAFCIWANPDKDGQHW